jgi:soluble lytic murein transglycosylase
VGLTFSWLWPGAAANAPDPNPVPLLAEARASWDRGELDSALEALDSLRQGPLADHVALIRGTLLAELSRPQDALAALGLGIEADPPSELRARLHLRAASIHLSLEALVDAYSEMEKAWESTRDKELAAELVAKLARAFEERNLPGDALGLYREAWKRWPLAEASETAYSRSLYLVEATAAERAPIRRHIDRANRLRSAYRCEAALPIYDAALAEGGLGRTLRAKVERGRADCLFQRQRYREAAVAYGKVAARETEDLSAAIRVARSLARAGDRDRALGKFFALAKRASVRDLAQIRYLIGIVVLAKEPERARKMFRAVERQKASPTLANLARWRIAWGELRAGNAAAAIRRLKPLTRGTRWDIEAQRGRYWTAVAQLELDVAVGEAQLRDLVEKVPLSYYGLLAAQRLRVEPNLERSFVGERPIAAFPRIERARWLIDGGFPEAAGDELESWRRERKLSRPERVAAAPLLHEIGSHFRAVRLLIDGFGGTLEEGVDPEWRDAWVHAWPRAFDKPVAEATLEFDSDPALIYAVMREESTYRAKVESPVGALGLMQITPPTGSRIATRLGIDPFEPGDLLTAKMNIRFGTYYLRELLDRYDGRRELAIAAYNAGPDAVSGWVNLYGTQRQDEFVDSVPYGETRRYLRRVIRSYHVYKWLYDRDAKAADESPSPAAD